MKEKEGTEMPFRKERSKMNTNQQNALSTVVRPARREGMLAGLIREYRFRTRADVFMDILIGVIACLFAQTHALFGVYPFATALLCSLKRHVPAALIGAALGCWFMGERGLLYLGFYAVLLLLRVVFSHLARRWFESDGLFDEHPLFRVLEASLLGCFMAAYELALFGVYDYTVLFALGAVFIPALLTLFFTAFAESGITLMSFLGKEEYKASDYINSYGFSVFVEVSGLAILFSVVFALSNISFFGIALGKCAITLFTLVISKRFGALRASAAALVISFAEGITYIPSFGLLGLLSGLCETVGMPCSLAAAVVAGGGFAVYVGGLSGFLAVVPEMALTALAAWPFLRTLPRADERFFRESAIITAEAKESPPEENVDSVADAYEGIAGALSEISTRERLPDKEEYALLCVKTKNEICRRCPAKGECAEEEAVLRGLAAVCRGEAVKEDPCEAFGLMKEVLGREAANLLRKKRKNENGIFAAEYALHARLLREQRFKEKLQREENTALSEVLSERLRLAGICVEEVGVTGAERYRVKLDGVRWQENGVGEEKLHEVCTAVCGKGLSSPTVFFNGKRISYYLESEEKFKATTVVASLPSVEKEPSGDKALGFSDEEGRAYALLCDGMGSGKGAESTAMLAVSVLSSLLRASVKEETALALLSNLLCAADEERSLSLDLLSMDLVKGEATFLKSGAAASFALRGGALYRIRAKSMPLGVFRETAGERVSLDIEHDDIFILLSDGVMQGNEDGGWLKDLISEKRDEDLKTFADRILATALMRAGEKRDDMTVILTKLQKTG